MKEFYGFPLHIEEEEHNAADNKFCEEQCFRNCVNISALATWKWSESEAAQSSPTLRDPMDCSPPGSSIHGIFQARGLEWGAIAFSRGSSGPRYRTQVSHIVGRRFSIWATATWIGSLKKKSQFSQMNDGLTISRGTVNNPVPCQEAQWPSKEGARRGPSLG